MITRTNLLWTGELISQLVWIIFSGLGILVIFPYLARQGFPDFGVLLYIMLGVVTLINVGATLWRWRSTSQKVQVLAAKPEQALAHWQYDQWAWQEYAQQQWRDTLWQMAKWAIFPIGIGLFVLYGWQQIFTPQIIVPMLVWMGINLLLSVISILFVPYYRILNTAPQALIFAEGLCIGGKAYFWEKGNVQLQGVRMAEQMPNLLEFKLRTQQGRNRSSETVRIPVPSGREPEAQRVIEMLSLRGNG